MLYTPFYFLSFKNYILFTQAFLPLFPFSNNATRIDATRIQDSSTPRAFHLSTSLNQPNHVRTLNLVPAPVLTGSNLEQLVQRVIPRISPLPLPNPTRNHHEKTKASLLNHLRFRSSIYDGKIFACYCRHGDSWFCLEVDMAPRFFSGESREWIWGGSGG